MAVDAVITWVDGNDPAHRARLGAYLQSIGSAPPAARAARFHDAGEIDWCVASILRHAPWIGRIFIVADAQTPPFLARIAGTPLGERIRIVDHREVFAGFERFLPTFNSRAIISTLWRIPGLAERFVYFNDDFSLLRPVREQDFFRDDGKVVVRGQWMRQSHRRPGRRIVQALKRLRGTQPDRAGNHDAQELSARLAGFADRYYRMFHNPYPMRRSTLQAFFDERPALFESNLAHRLRSSAQFKAEVLAAHLEIARGDAVFDNALHTVQLKPRQQSPRRVRAKMAAADREADAAFACVQSLELADADLQADIIGWLRRHVGEPV